MNKSIAILSMNLLILFNCCAQADHSWQGKGCAVVLTYDDGLNIDLTNVIPALDSAGLKGTFYISDYFDGLAAQIERWRAAAAEGHELGNHTVWHPCDGRLPGRSFVQPDYDLNNYDVHRMDNEIRVMNTILKAIDGTSQRTFAYPCGDRKIHDSSYLDPIKTEFAAARGVSPEMLPIDKIDLYNVGCYAMNGQSADEMISLVKKAMDTHTLLVFLFHGVGGEHSQNVSLEAHRGLLHFLKQYSDSIWVAPMIEVARYIRGYRSGGHAAASDKGLKDYYKDYFPIGVAVSPKDLTGEQAAMILQQFNSLTPENAMKMGVIHPKENEYFWKDADSIVNFAQHHGLKIRGHNLCWQEQTPDWLFKDHAGNLVGKDVLLKRLKDHITTVVNRYKGKIYAWDVVNEAIADDSLHFLKNSLWYRICGPDYVAKAFQYAHDADPDALLFYNDYNTERPGKREKVYQLLKQLIDAGVPVNAVGLQGHWNLDEPTPNDLIATIQRMAALGLKVQVTELDVSIYPWEKNRRPKGAADLSPDTAQWQARQAEQYKKVFTVLREDRNIITGVTFWNVSDKDTWLDHYPVEGRKNYPLLFDQYLQPKKAYLGVVDF